MGFLFKEMRVRDYAKDKEKESPRSVYNKTAPYWYLIIRSSYIREKDVQETSSLENMVLRYMRAISDNCDIASIIYPLNFHHTEQ